MTEIIITKPDDMHLHLREGKLLEAVIKDTEKQFARAIVMPNLKNPVVDVEKATVYYKEIKKFSTIFEPLMTLYFTDKLTLNEIKKASDSSIIIGIKLYPAGVTTNSAKGLKSIEDSYHLFEAMEKTDLPLLIHGEVSDKNVDIFDREKSFIDNYLIGITKNFPNLRVVFEHISTQDAVSFVNESSQKVAATITPQHILMNRNDLLSGGIKPHNYCLPVLKRSTHQQAVLNAAVSGNPKFFLGTDSAPHLRHEKESACGCAGVYSAATAIELYAEIFEKNNALDKLEDFSSTFGADFYQLPRNKTKLKLIKNENTIAKSIKFDGGEIIPFMAGNQIQWQSLAL